MKYFKVVASLGLSVSLICGCANPRVDLARMESIKVKSDEIEYRQVSTRFIKLAQVGNLIGLIRLTSPRTLHTQGGEKVADNYKRKLIPAFKNSRIEWDLGSTIIYDLNYNVGLEFSGMVHGLSPTSFYISIFKEDGKIVIANIRKTQMPAVSLWGQSPQ